MQASADGLDGDVFIRYPVMLEQWLMEGAYDRVWGALKGKGVPSEEFAVFSEVMDFLPPSLYNGPMGVSLASFWILSLWSCAQRDTERWRSVSLFLR